MKSMMKSMGVKSIGKKTSRAAKTNINFDELWPGRESAKGGATARFARKLKGKAARGKKAMKDHA